MRSLKFTLIVVIGSVFHHVGSQILFSPNLQFFPKNQIFAGMLPTELPLERGFAKIPFVSPYNIEKYVIPENEEQSSINQLCQNVDKMFRRFRWKKSPCGSVKWHADIKTKEGHPIIYASYGEGRDTTLFLGGVHPDELTPINLSFRFAQHLHDNPELYRKHGIKVVVAPLVNPDGFLQKYPSRSNRVVDVNRNFFTIDWYDKALNAWKKRRGGLTRYFPGYFPNTEIETFFQIKLIDKYKPDKIFSVHAPLGFLDYDGPGDQKSNHLSPKEKTAKQFVYAVAKKTRNYRVVDYSFYPGSLGNYAGNERNLPTITLELKTTNPNKVDEYWMKFLPGFLQSMHYPFEKTQSHSTDNATRFFSMYDKIINE